MRWLYRLARIGERRVVHGVLVGRSEEKRPLGRHGHRWENDDDDDDNNNNNNNNDNKNFKKWKGGWSSLI
jgi:hypothetical protein